MCPIDMMALTNYAANRISSNLRNQSISVKTKNMDLNRNSLQRFGIKNIGKNVK